MGVIFLSENNIKAVNIRFKVAIIYKSVKLTYNLHGFRFNIMRAYPYDYLNLYLLDRCIPLVYNKRVVDKNQMQF